MEDGFGVEIGDSERRKARFAALLLATVGGGGLWHERACAVRPSLSKGIQRLERRDFAKATQLLKAAVREEPKYAASHRFLAKALECGGEWGHAATACRRLAALGVPDRSAVAQHAQNLAAAHSAGLSWHPFQTPGPPMGYGGKHPSCKLISRLTRETYPHSVLRYWALAWQAKSANARGDMDEAIRRYEGLFKEGPPVPLPFCKYELATAYVRKGAFPKGEKVYRQLLASKQPIDPALRDGAKAGLARAYLEWGKQDLGRKIWHTAEIRLRRAYELGSSAAVGPYVEVLKQRAKFVQAADVVQEEIQAGAMSSKDLASVYVLWAQYKKRRCDYQGIEDLFTAAKALDPDARPGLAVDAVIENEEQGAQQLLEKAKDLSEVRGKHAEALELLSGIRANFPKTKAAVMALMAKGDALHGLRKWHAAVAAYRRFLKRHPNDDLAPYAQMKVIYFLSGMAQKPKQAAAECQALVRDYPDSKYAAEACYLRGMLYATRLKNNRAALACFNETIDRYPDSFWATKWASKRIGELREEGAQ